MEEPKGRPQLVPCWIEQKGQTIEKINQGLGVLGKLETVTTAERDDELWFWAREDGEPLKANAWKGV